MRKFILLSILFISSVTRGQQVNLELHFKNWQPRCIGPSGMSGRITAIDALIDNPNVIILGAASGGVWRTENGGADWTPIFDDQPTLNIGAVAIQQSNPSVIWVGTGEGNPRNSLNIGEGVYKTLDGGKTWKRMGLEKTRNIHRVFIHPDNPDVVYAGAIGNPYAEHSERGVFKTINGGQTWERILYTNDTSGVGDMIMDPSNPNKLFVGMWQHRRTPWSMKSGGKGSGLFMTVDGGKNWKQLGKDDGLPDGNLGRIGLAMSRKNPKIIYALIEASRNGLYKSEDGGYKWQLVTADPQIVTNRPFYFQDIAVDPENENRVWLIYQMISVSEDGGKSFRTVIPYRGIHPDHHAFWIHPKNGNFIIDGNDGGIGISRDRGKTWQFDDKLPVGQFYHINVDNEMPYNVMGGMQDNGSWRGPAYTWTGGGIKNYYWESLWSGDGFDVMPDPEDANWVYAMSQEGGLGRYNVKTGERWQIKPPTPDLGKRLRFNWNAAIAQDPFDKNSIYFGSQHLHKSANKGASWEMISGDLTTNDSIKIDQRNNGGLSIDITGAENFCTLLTIAPSPKEQGVIWVGTDDGNVQLTRDGGKTWTNFRGKIPGLPLGAWIPQIKASQFNGGEAFVVANDYRRGDFKPYIFRTTDYGKTWTRLVDEKKVNGYALCVIQDPAEPNLIFAGTEHGLWVSLDNGSTFQQWKNGYPSVSTYDLAIQEREADLVIATFGRAIYVLDDIRPLRALASSKGIVSKPLMVFSPGDAYQVSYRNQPGYEWSTWGLWDAENRPRGAAISYFMTPARDTSRRAGRDSVAVKIFNEKNENIRNLKWKVDSGLNRSYWAMDEKGVRFPGSGRGRTAAEPSGWQVLPGRYKVVLTAGRNSDSTYITVKDDPRIENRNNIKVAQREMLLRLRKSSEKLTEGLDRLLEAEEITQKVDAQIKGIEGRPMDSLRRSTKVIQDSIKAIREFINGKPETRQGTGSVPQITVINQLGAANSAITSKPLAPGQQEEMLVKRAEDLIAEAIRKINQFFQVNWSAYRRQVEETPVKLFKDYNPL